MTNSSTSTSVSCTNKVQVIESAVDPSRDARAPGWAEAGGSILGETSEQDGEGRLTRGDGEVVRW